MNNNDSDIVHYQMGYVTNDIDRAYDIFINDYGLTKAFMMKDAGGMQRFPAGPEYASMHLFTGWIGNLHYEIIQPVSGKTDLYSDFLPKSGFGIVFHHFGYEVAAPIERWESLREELYATKKVAVESPEETPLKAIYIDERERLGHYHEYVWFPPDFRRRKPLLTEKLLG